MSEDNVLVQERKEKLVKLRELGINPYPYKYNRSSYSQDLIIKYSKLESGEKSVEQVSVAGRIMQLRRMGKATFAHLQDSKGRVQVYFREDDLNQTYHLLKQLDIGDIIGCEGKVFKTKLGEVTIYVNKFEILTKSLLPLPEKFHGLQDPELRYRMRYVDLIMNPDVKEVFIKRAKIIDTIRSYLKNKDFIEVETPLLQTIYGGASAAPFETHLNALNMNLFMAISPELYLKRLIVGGMEKVFTITKNFRNEGIDKWHNPEFTMMEFYNAYVNYETLMKMTEELFEEFKVKLGLGNVIEYQGKGINLATPFKRVKFRDLIFNETGIDINQEDDFDKLKQAILDKDLRVVDIRNCSHYGALLDELYKRVARPNIVQPTFLTHYPVEMIALAKRNDTDPRKINSFQLLIDGAEVVKAYDELNDPIDQQERLLKQARLLSDGTDDAMPMDEDFIKALKYGMPPTAGYGMGIDRLTMLLTNSGTIRDVILFPFMKEVNGE